MDVIRWALGRNCTFTFIPFLFLTTNLEHGGCDMLKIPMAIGQSLAVIRAKSGGL